MTALPLTGLSLLPVGVSLFPGFWRLRVLPVPAKRELSWHKRREPSGGTTPATAFPGDYLWIILDPGQELVDHALAKLDDQLDQTGVLKVGDDLRRLHLDAGVEQLTHNRPHLKTETLPTSHPVLQGSVCPGTAAVKVRTASDQCCPGGGSFNHVRDFGPREPEPVT